MKTFIVFSVICVSSTISNNDVHSRQRRIAGGEVADNLQYPFATSLLNDIGATVFQQVCGGTILSGTAILSAASCFVTNDQVTPALSWRARVGSTSSVVGGLVYIITRITPHPQYSTSTKANDVAVIRTTTVIGFGAAVQPAYIAGGAYRLHTNDPVVAVGWGAINDTGAHSTELRHVQIWVNDQRVCAERYSSVNFTVIDSMLCAGWLDIGIRGQCVGDTGSPLLHNGVVVGVFSMSRGCADALLPNINTRVSTHARWIEAIATVP